MDYKEIILELLMRVQNLEKEVASLTAVKSISQIKSSDNLPREEGRVLGKRDTTRYLFNGSVFPKNRLVLAVVQKYIEKNPQITRDELKHAFDKSLQGSMGVVENSEIASNIKDYNIRFFTKETETLKLVDGEMYVCAQWGIINLPYFLKRAEQLGFEIKNI